MFTEEQIKTLSGKNLTWQAVFKYGVANSEKILFPAFIVLDPTLGFSVKPLDPEEVEKEIERGMTPWGVQPKDPKFCFYTISGVVSTDDIFNLAVQYFSKDLAIHSFEGWLEFYKETTGYSTFGTASSCIL